MALHITRGCGDLDHVFGMRLQHDQVDVMGCV